jgi:hypothetical protein
MGVGNTINFAPEAYSKKPALGIPKRVWKIGSTLGDFIEFRKPIMNYFCDFILFLESIIGIIIPKSVAKRNDVSQSTIPIP